MLSTVCRASPRGSGAGGTEYEYDYAYAGHEDWLGSVEMCSLCRNNTNTANKQRLTEQNAGTEKNAGNDCRAGEVPLELLYL